MQVVEAPGSKLLAATTDVVVVNKPSSQAGLGVDRGQVGLGQRRRVRRRVLGPAGLGEGGHPGLAQHIGASLMADEFDMSFFQHRALDPQRGVPGPAHLRTEERSGRVRCC